MRVVLFSRRPRPAMNFSIELITEGLLRELRRQGLHATHAVCRFESNGLVRRAYNALEASRRQGDVNHITGDVHFLAYLMDPRRTLLTIHDCGRIAGEMDLRKRAIRQLWFRGPARHCAAVTVVSETVKAELLSHVDIPPSKVHVVPSFVPDVYRSFPRPFNEARPTILHVGTAPNKNLPRLAAALEGLACRLVVVGRLSETQTRALTQHRVQYENHVGVSTERMLQLYVDCDLVSFASTFEGFGMPIIEANLVGRPIVTSSVASMPEVAADAACLVDPFDVADIRRGLLCVIQHADFRAQIVERGFVNARRFEPDRIAARYAEIYRSIVDHASPGASSQGARGNGLVRT